MLAELWSIIFSRHFLKKSPFLSSSRFHRVVCNDMKNVFKTTSKSALYLKTADISSLAFFCFNLLLIVSITTQNIWFYDKFIENDIPKYILLKTQNRSPAVQRGIRLGRRKWHLKHLFLGNHTELLSRLKLIEFSSFDSITKEKVQNFVNKKFWNRNENCIL